MNTILFSDVNILVTKEGDLVSVRYDGSLKEFLKFELLNLILKIIKLNEGVFLV